MRASSDDSERGRSDGAAWLPQVCRSAGARDASFREMPPRVWRLETVLSRAKVPSWSARPSSKGPVGRNSQKAHGKRKIGSRGWPLAVWRISPACLAGSSEQEALKQTQSGVRECEGERAAPPDCMATGMLRRLPNQASQAARKELDCICIRPCLGTPDVRVSLSQCALVCLCAPSAVATPRSRVQFAWP